MNNDVTFNISAAELLASFLTFLQEKDGISDPHKSILVDPARFAQLIDGIRSSSVPRPVIQGTPVVGQPVSTFNPEDDPYSQFIGKNMFLRGGIFAFLGHLVSNHKDYIVCKDVLWFADTGEYQALMQMKRGVHLDKLSSCKPQWYQPGRLCVIAKKLFSDISEFEGDFAPSKNLKLKAAQAEEWELDPFQNPLNNLIGKQVFLRNGIFAYSGILRAVYDNGIELDHIVWYADTGDYQGLLNADKNTHIGSLNGCKPQWYKPELVALFNSELFSDIFEIEVNTTFKP